MKMKHFAWIGVAIIVLGGFSWYAVHVYLEMTETFDELRSSLSHTSVVFINKNEKLASEISATLDTMPIADEQKGQLRDDLNQITTQTGAIESYLGGLVSKLEQIGELDPKTGEIKHKSEFKKNWEFWMGEDPDANDGHGAGEASVLRQKLEAYSIWAGEFGRDRLKMRQIPDDFVLVENPAINPAITSDQPNKDATWEYYIFHDKPLVADLAMLEKYRMDVSEIEFELLTFFNARLNTIPRLQEEI